MDTRPKIVSLPVIADEDTIHDLPENLGPSHEEMPQFHALPLPAETFKVLIEDIIGSCAAIVSKENIYELAKLAHQ